MCPDENVLTRTRTNFHNHLRLLVAECPLFHLDGGGGGDGDPMSSSSTSPLTRPTASTPMKTVTLPHTMNKEALALVPTGQANSSVRVRFNVERPQVVLRYPIRDAQLLV